MTDHAEATQKMWSMMKGIGFAMMTTDDSGSLRARPMVAAQDEFDGNLYFFTRASSHKVQEAGAGDPVGVTYADPGKQDYVSLSGHSTVVRDKATIDAHWQESLRTWFPGGKEDPDIAILKVKVEMAEYWDAPNSKMVHAYGYVKSLVTGTPPSPGENEKLKFA